jgi:SAM-dependent methyltransferase
VCDETELAASATKADVPYWACRACDVLFAEQFDAATIFTHNEAPEERADPHTQATRLQRISSALGRRPRRILDFGCGLGQYVEYLNSNGFDAIGIDQDTPLQLSDLAMGDIDAINMVEVIEHLMQPRELLLRLVDILEPGGVLYAESSFIDHLGDPDESDYVDPRIGHCCIHSTRSVAYLAWCLRVELTWLNNNVFILRKGHDRAGASTGWPVLAESNPA